MQKEEEFTMESPPSCSAWSGLAHSVNKNFLYKSSSLSSGLEYIESEEEKSSSEPAVWIAPPVEFRDTPPTGPAAPSPLRPSTSHNSLSVPTPNRADDSSFITSAMSHDALIDLYNVPLDSDIYTIPIDSVRPRPTARRHRQNGKKRRRQTLVETNPNKENERGNKRQSAPPASEPVHMTLQEVRQFLQTLYNPHGIGGGKKQKKRGEDKAKGFSYVLKETLCNMFFRRRRQEPERVLVLSKMPFTERALPPLPDKSPVPTLISREEESAVDFAASIEKVKDYGWYWGPISGEAAEKVLSNEPDGSFIVRDSSDHHYIFSLTFRLNGCVRHVRIEHDQGNFSFGSCTKFKSQTIVEFIETAVEHSRSGRYLFFLHRRPILGPMRVQLLHPVSRFKHVQSLQHLCRFVIVKAVRRDLIPRLPLPRRLIDYLSTPQYYSEQLPEQDPPSPSSIHLFAFSPP